MKTNISKIDPTDYNGKIVIMQKKVGNVKDYELIKALNTFITSDMKVFNSAMEQEIQEIMRKNGIVIKDTTEKAIREALLRCPIQIIDRHENTCEKVVYKTKSGTVIYYDNMFEIANEIKELNYGKRHY